MRIVFFTSTDDHLGGAKSLLELVELLKEQNIEVIVVNPYHNQLNEKLEALKIENYSCGYQMNICKKDCGGMKYFLKYFIKYVRYQLCRKRSERKAEKYIDFSTVDIIHTNNSTEDIAVNLARKYKIPHVWHLREFGDLDFNFQYFHKNIGDYISDNADKVIAISNVIKSEWVKKGVATEKVVTICHGVNGNNIRVAEHFNKVIKIVFTGAIIPTKGQAEFILAFSKLSKEERKLFSIDFYGSGEKSYVDELRRTVSKYDMDNIVAFKGYSNNIYDLLNEYDIGVVNSYCEAMGRVTIEYMFAGLCVLASDTGANLELIQEGKNGLFYKYGNVESIAEKLRYIANNRDVISDIGRNARKSAVENYDIQINVKKYIELYKSLQG